MKFSTYRILDLIILAIIGMIVEAAGVYATNIFIYQFTAYSVVGVLIVLVAFTRWKWWGLTLIPFMAFANFICGKFWIPQESCRQTYTWFRMIYTMISYLSVLISLAFYKKKEPNKIYKNLGSTFEISTAIVAIQIIVVCSGQWIEFGLPIGISASAIFGQILSNSFHCLFSYVFLILFGMILGAQNIMTNVHDDLIKKRQEENNEKEYYSNLIKPIDDPKSSDTIESSNRKDCDHDGA